MGPPYVNGCVVSPGALSAVGTIVYLVRGRNLDRSRPALLALRTRGNTPRKRNYLKKRLRKV